MRAINGTESLLLIGKNSIRNVRLVLPGLKKSPHLVLFLVFILKKGEKASVGS